MNALQHWSTLPAALEQRTLPRQLVLQENLRFVHIRNCNPQFQPRPMSQAGGLAAVESSRMQMQVKRFPKGRPALKGGATKGNVMSQSALQLTPHDPQIPYVTPGREGEHLFASSETGGSRRATATLVALPNAQRAQVR